MPEHTNRLINESSPYLRQHAHNPVDWYPWGPEAWEKARRENKPVLLSVGYSACHWCHVMERESFENSETARLMNQHFVNVKVDREERPDVDHIYMTAVQSLTGHGGWPMTVFLTPEGKPFYGGTYFPPEDRHGLPGFPRLLASIAAVYREKPSEVEKNVAAVMERLAAAEAVRPGPAPPDAALPVTAAAALARAYDERYGGLGQAPKFPNTSAFDLFLRVHHRTGERAYLDMVTHTLRRMAEGGIYDQLGGGFHRYSVDRQWLVPHFEKMLYDNAQLVPLYLSAHLVTGDPFFARIAGETLDYVAREMRDPAGGFYSTQDADSEGEEGKFFVWEPGEIEDRLGEEIAEIVCRYWDISEEGNFEHRSILHPTLTVEQLARLFRREPEEVGRLLDEARARLLAAREKRVKPARDEKILTAWNGLMISAFAKGAEVLGEERYERIALEAVGFVQNHLQRGDRLLSTYKDGVARLNGYLDDYAFFTAALLDVFEATQDRRHLDEAARLTDSLLKHFWDENAGGGFFFTSDDHEELIVRSKPAFDGSIPSGNSVAALNLLRLYHLTGRIPYLERADALFRLFANPMAEQPFGFANMIAAFDFAARSPLEIVLVGDRAAAGTRSLLKHIRQTYVPNRSLVVLDPADPSPRPALLEGKGQVDRKATVYVCHRRACSAPATTWEEVAALLAQ
jgi:uncharacterized protein YyaL (SSP411 family)